MKIMEKIQKNICFDVVFLFKNIRTYLFTCNFFFSILYPSLIKVYLHLKAFTSLSFLLGYTHNIYLWLFACQSCMHWLIWLWIDHGHTYTIQCIIITMEVHQPHHVYNSRAAADDSCRQLNDYLTPCCSVFSKLGSSGVSATEKWE